MCEENNCKYGKSMTDVLDIKRNFFEENEKLLENNEKIAAFYKTQPIRKTCKLCGNALGDEAYFVSHQIVYVKCEVCGHVNGIYEDTKDFVDYLYNRSDYANTYRCDKEAYMNRVEQVYAPKMKFLAEYLGEDIEQKKILDIGAGSGYFVAAGIQRNLKITGVEISKEQVELAGQMIGPDLVRQIEEDALIKELEDTDAQIVSAIGVLEHLRDLRGVLGTIRNNPKIQYLYASVPMQSFSVLLEVMNQDIYNRQLGAGHTHLFTNQSIECMCREFGFEKVAYWKFGSDMMDLYRMLYVKCAKNPKLLNDLENMDKNIFDEMQRVLDHAGVASENHFILRKVSEAGN